MPSLLFTWKVPQLNWDINQSSQKKSKIHTLKFLIGVLHFLCPIHVVTFTLISILATDYIQMKKGQALFFWVAKFDTKEKMTKWTGHLSFLGFFPAYMALFKEVLPEGRPCLITYMFKYFWENVFYGMNIKKIPLIKTYKFVNSWENLSPTQLSIRAPRLLGTPEKLLPFVSQ